MINSIKGIDPRITKKMLNPGKQDEAGPSFSERLQAVFDDTNKKQHTADSAVQKVTKGEMDIQDGMIALSEADITLRYFTQVRSKVLAAYNEIIKMPI